MIAESLNVGCGVRLIKTVQVHPKHNAHSGNVHAMVWYPGTVASLNKHNWNKQQCLAKKSEICPIILEEN